MLNLYIENGRLVKKLPTLKEIRELTLINFEKLPQTFKSINQYMTLTPELSNRLIKATEELQHRLKKS